MKRADELYVGYFPTMPRGHWRRTLPVAVGFVVAVAAAMGALALGQTKADVGLYEFGILKPREGILRGGAIPLLESTDAEGRPVNYLLVGATKVAPPAEFLALAERRVRFDGVLVQRGSQAMLEVGPAESWSDLGAAPPATQPQRIEGTTTLVGELIDTKCFFGAMRPAVGKIHRGCAIRCLSGGIPPALRIVDSAGHESIVMLAGRDGRPAPIDPTDAGLSVEASGSIEVQGNVIIMRADRVVARP